MPQDDIVFIQILKPIMVYLLRFNSQLSPVHKIFSMGARTMLLTFARDFRL